MIRHWNCHRGKSVGGPRRPEYESFTVFEAEHTAPPRNVAP